LIHKTPPRKREKSASHSGLSGSSICKFFGHHEVFKNYDFGCVRRISLFLFFVPFLIFPYIIRYMFGCALQERFLRVCDPPPVPCRVLHFSCSPMFLAKNRGGRGSKYIDPGSSQLLPPPRPLRADGSTWIVFLHHVVSKSMVSVVLCRKEFLRFPSCIIRDFSRRGQESTVRQFRVAVQRNLYTVYLQLKTKILVFSIER